MKSGSMSHEQYSLENDMVAKFKMYEGHEEASSKVNLLEYLSKNHTGPLTKSGLMEYVQ